MFIGYSDIRFNLFQMQCFLFILSYLWTALYVNFYFIKERYPNKIYNATMFIFSINIYKVYIFFTNHHAFFEPSLCNFPIYKLSFLRASLIELFSDSIKVSKDISGWLCLYKLLYAVSRWMDDTFSAFLSQLSQDNIVWGVYNMIGKIRSY